MLKKSSENTDVIEPLQLTGDLPKKTLKEDELGLTDMAEALAATLSNQVTADGYVIGIEAPWGYGKTSFINFVTEILEKKEHHHVIHFSPWLVGDRNVLIYYFFDLLAERIERFDNIYIAPKANRKKLAREIRKYGSFAGKLSNATATAIPLDPTGISTKATLWLKLCEAVSHVFRSSPASLEELKARIIKDLNLLKEEGNIRFTIIIDDLDRIEANEACEIIRLIKAVADFPLISYVLCYDPDILAKHLKTCMQIDDGRAFKEKIVQNVVKMPPHEAFVLRRMLKEKLQEFFPDAMGESGFNDSPQNYQVYYLFDIWAGKLLRTPRDVIRLIEAVKLSWPPIETHANFLDCIWLQLIKLKAHDLYKWVERYVSSLGAYRDGGLVNDSSAKNMAEELYRILLALGSEKREQNDSFVEIEPYTDFGIGYFLPGVKTVSLSGEKRKVFNFKDDDLANFEQNKRLGSPSHWSMYFRFSIPSYALSDEIVTNFRKIAGACEVSFNPEHPMIQQGISLFREQLYRSHVTPGHYAKYLVDRLASEPLVSSLTEAEVQGMALIFSEVMDEAGKVTGVGNWGRIEIWENAEKIFWRSEVSSSQVSELFVNRFFSGSSINWLAFIVRQQGFAYGRPESKDNKIRPEFQWLAESQLNKVIDNLTLRFWQIGADNIFSAPSPSDILFCWLQLYSKEDKGQSVIQFIKQTTQNNDDMFLKALNAMRGWQNSSSDGLTHPLRQRTVAFFMDADEAKARLEKLVSKNDKAKELLSAWTDEDF